MESHGSGESEMAHEHGIWDCDGEPHMGEGGSWIGHFAPGIVFLVWGLHWMQGVFRNYFNSCRTKGQEYRAQTTYALWKFPAISESVCKAFLPIAAMSLELYFAHNGGWRTMICPAGSARAGHFVGGHTNNWQHASMYPPFILSGVVDLVGHEVELPPGTQQAFLFLAFLCEALLMGLHKKHTPLDIAVHEVLFYTMLTSAVLVLLEAIHPRNFLLSCGRVASLFLQSAWFIAAAHIMFEGRTAWDEMGGGDMAPSMMVPVFFVFCILVVATGVLLAFLLFHAYYKYLDSRGVVAYERTGLLDEDCANKAAVPSATLGCNSGTSCQV